jgi:hypothetical protein
MAIGEKATAATASVVLVGAFNPAIFHPQWLKDNKVIGAEEATDFKTDEDNTFVFKDLSVVSLPDAGIQIAAQRDRLSVTVNQDPPVLVRDIAYNCLTLLSHTPIRQMGINRGVTFRPIDEDEAHKLGDLLAPKLPWVELFGPVDGPRSGGLRTITMERVVRPDAHRGFIRVTLTALANTRDCKIDVNDHYDLLDGSEPVSGTAARDQLAELWDASLARSNKIIAALLENCNVIV